MRIQQFLEHYGLGQNPFSQEDAQNDALFKMGCAKRTFHPAWDKIYGSPTEPETAVVFGEKGSGKTALRLQIVEHLAAHNQAYPNSRVFVVEYDDFNPFLDCFSQRCSALQRRMNKVLSRWRLWDHIDAILSLSVTRLVNDILTTNSEKQPGAFEIRAEQLTKLSREEKRDLLLLAAYYDRSTGMHPLLRWNRLRQRMRFSNWKTWTNLAIGVGVTAAASGFMAYSQNWAWLKHWGFWAALVAGWLPWLWMWLGTMWQAWRVSRQVRVVDHPLQSLRQILSRIPSDEMHAQPAPRQQRTDDRYELLSKLQRVLKALGFTGMVVLVDRVDEPHLINGAPERMRDLLWPLFDNKLLRHSGLGFKLLLPAEVSHYLQRETTEFYEKSRLDKQNLVRSLDWTGQSLYDLASARIAAAVKPGTTPAKLRDWFDPALTEDELITSLGRLRVPRHLFRFLHQLIVSHSQQYTDDAPSWSIGRDTFRSTLNGYLRDLEAFDRGLGTG